MKSLWIYAYSVAFILSMPFTSIGNELPLQEIKHQKMYFCTAADSRYYKAVVNLIASIHRLNYEETGQIAVFDLGLTAKEIAHLNSISKVQVYEVEKVHPAIITPIQTHPGKKTPGSYAWKPVILKQALDMFPYVLYLDAGTTILKPLDDLFKHIIQNGSFMIDVGPWSIYLQCTKRVVQFFNLESTENAWMLAPDVHTIDAGMQGISHQLYDSYVLPVYELAKNHFELFVDDGTTPTGLCRHDQPLFSIYARLLGLEHLLFDTDGTEGQLTLLTVDSQTVPIHITCYTDRVTENTTIFRSRGYCPHFDFLMSFVRYKSKENV